MSTATEEAGYSKDDIVLQYDQVASWVVSDNPFIELCFYPNVDGGSLILEWRDDYDTQKSVIQVIQNGLIRVAESKPIFSDRPLFLKKDEKEFELDQTLYEAIKEEALRITNNRD